MVKFLAKVPASVSGLAQRKFQFESMEAYSKTDSSLNYLTFCLRFHTFMGFGDIS